MRLKLDRISHELAVDRFDHPQLPVGHGGHREVFRRFGAALESVDRLCRQDFDLRRASFRQAEAVDYRALNV